MTLAEDNGEDDSSDRFKLLLPEEIGINRVFSSIILDGTAVGGVISKSAEEMEAFSSDDAVGPLILVRGVSFFSSS